jgi:hypothetical protein
MLKKYDKRSPHDQTVEKDGGRKNEAGDEEVVKDPFVAVNPTEDYDKQKDKGLDLEEATETAAACS